jgi:ribonuclease T1
MVTDSGLTRGHRFVKRAWVLGCILGASVVLGGCSKDRSDGSLHESVAPASQAPEQPAQPVGQQQPPAVADEQKPDGLNIVRIAELPRQAVATLQRIEAGGPFPFEKDGVVFGNRERLLPRHSRGYYHEYTVPTPRSRDRGARRIVCGGPKQQTGDCYYTDDHYATFRRIAD